MKPLGRSAWIAAATCLPLALGVTDPAAAQNPQITATLASVNTPSYINPRMQMVFIEKVKEYTNGGLTIEWVGSGQLGGLKENLEAVMAGNLEMCGVANANLGPLSPGPMLFDLPFIFRDYDHMKQVTRGPIGEKVFKEFEEKTGIKLLMTGLPDGARSIWNDVRPVRTPEDVKGLKLRVMQSPLLIDAFTLLGAIPTPMSSTEVYMAVNQGVIDGAEWGPLGMIEQKSYEQTKYYTLTKHLNSPGAVAVSLEWFNSLPPDYQAAILKASDEARAWFDSEFDKNEAAALAELRTKGLEIIEDPELGPFIEAVRPVYDKYAEQVGGWEMIQQVLDTK